jgi:hypothetical protein
MFETIDPGEQAVARRWPLLLAGILGCHIRSIRHREYANSRASVSAWFDSGRYSGCTAVAYDQKGRTLTTSFLDFRRVKPRSFFPH